MTVTYNPNHSAEAVARLTSQFKDKPLLVGLLRGFITDVQPEENAIFGMIAGRELATAVGMQLDLFGTIVNEDRRGRNDDEYRLALYARISINISNATAEAVLRIFNLITGSPITRMEELFPAEVGFFATVDISTLDVIKILQIMQDVVAGGVKVYGIGQYDGLNGGFAFAGIDPTGRGFGDFDDPSVGGTFATLLAVP